MKKDNMIISFNNDPVLFEQTLRANLAGDNHTKETLIEFGVYCALELERTKIERDSYMNKHAKLVSEFNLGRQFLNMRSWTNAQIAEVLKKDFGLTEAADLIQRTENKTNSKRASNAGKHDRKLKPSKQELESHRDDFYYKNDKTQGWKKSACREFDISPKTLNNILTS